ncbi:hypothetical protein LJC63_04635 [Ruminococcaceae bacterium OttesenSCG-928-L11]|nr:hypothetical protein [Ruminococcaceae bacterium OttesenSCG-928-L11]
MKSSKEKAGAIVLLFGVIVLVLGIVLGLTYGTYLVAVLLTSSIVINTVGILLLQSGGGKRK